jgi:alanine dehydrogenase
MLIGIPKEIKNHEYRVAVTPSGVRHLIKAGHTVRVQAGAASRIGYLDTDYIDAGAEITATAKAIYEADLIVKVKEPQPEEVALMHEGQIIFSYLHLAAEAELTQQLLDRKITGIAFETVTDPSGGLPLDRKSVV